LIDPKVLSYDANGLIPVVVQDDSTKEILMLGYANQETLSETIESGRMVFYSRSRSERWLKGETSGNFLHVSSIYADCDKDALVAMVHPDGPACHRGTTSCFEAQP
jgi:phosphoribosyl-ATP pyrophosphohydrolase/phosphoribosyl-AMP cyclohydrolase